MIAAAAVAFIVFLIGTGLLFWVLWKKIYLKEGFQTETAAPATGLDAVSAIPDPVWDEESAKQVCPYLHMAIETLKETIKHAQAFQMKEVPFGAYEQNEEIIKSYKNQMRIFKCDKVGYKVSD